MTPWRRVAATSPLTKLHTKFWDKSIDEDRSKWENEQRGVGVPMEVEGSDVGPGCFILDLKIDSALSKLWVRQDYIRLYDGCNTYFNEISNLDVPPPSVVITGQPGIGKSSWLTYAVRRRLGEAKPFLWYYELTWNLFVKDGVFQSPPRLPVTAFRPYLWTFVDADSMTSVPSVLPVLETKVFTIFTTSPIRSRWKSLEKGTSCLALIMNPWTSEEIRWAAIAHRFSEEQYENSKRIFQEYGPTARLCINFVKRPDDLILFQASRTSTINNLSIRELVKYVNEDDLTDFTIEPMTDSVRRLLKFRLMRADWTEQLRAYERCERVERSRPMASLLFGSMAQLQVQEGGVLNLIRMVKQQTRKKPAQWTSQPGNVSTVSDSMGQGSGSMRVDGANPIIPVRLEPKNVVQYAGPVLETFQPGVFYVPKPSAQAAFDSFILIDGYLLIFQFTIEPSHKIKGNIVEFFSQPTLRSMFQAAKTLFIFVIRPGETIICPEVGGTKLEGFWNRVTLFSAELNPTKKT